MDTWRLEEALKQHVYAMGQCVLAQDRIAGMKAENEAAADRGESIPYREEAFEKAMYEFSIDHNSIIEAFTY